MFVPNGGNVSSNLSSPRTKPSGKSIYEKSLSHRAGTWRTSLQAYHKDQDKRPSDKVNVVGMTNIYPSILPKTCDFVLMNTASHPNQSDGRPKSTLAPCFLNVKVKLIS